MKTVRILGVPMDLGQSRRGVDMGPSAVRYAGLQDRLARLGYQVYDCGNVVVPVVEEVGGHQSGTDSKTTSSKAAKEADSAHYLAEVVQVCQAIYDQITQCVGQDEFAICL